MNLTPGPRAFPFIGRRFGDELAACQRYLRVFAAGQVHIVNPYVAVSLSGGGQHAAVLRSLQPAMRATPTIRNSSGVVTANHTFRYNHWSAGVDGDYLITLTAVSSVSVSQGYSSGSNGGNNLASSYLSGLNLAPIWLDAEL